MLLVSGRVSVPKPLSQIQRSTRWLLQGLSPRPSFGGFGVRAGKFFDGDTSGNLFEASQTADQAIGHTLSVWLFLGLSFLKLGIGFAIATIVRNLRATGRGTLEAYASAGVDVDEASRWQEPWFGRHFTKLLFAGILVMGGFFLLTLCWDGAPRNAA